MKYNNIPFKIYILMELQSARKKEFYLFNIKYEKDGIWC